MAPGQAGIWNFPYAGDEVAENVRHAGRLYCFASATRCRTHSLSEEIRLALGTQAGPVRLADIF